MAVFAVTNTFQNLTTVTAEGHNTNWSDVTTWLNNRYNGVDTWLFMKVSSTDANPADITSSGASTELSINNTASDGDPFISFKLSGSRLYSFGVDDSDSDGFNFGTTGLTTNVAMRIPSTGAQAQFSVGSESVPSMSFIANQTTGFFLSSGAVIRYTSLGANTLAFTSVGLEVTKAAGIIANADGLVGAPSYSWVLDPDSGFWRPSSNVLAFSLGGAEVIRFASAGVADTTNYDTLKQTSGGGSAAVTSSMYTRTGVTTSAVHIGTPAGLMDVFYVVGDQSATDIFNDIVVCSFASSTATVVLSKTANGSPAARTYVSSGAGSLTLEMASGTYDIQTYKTSLTGR